MALLEKLLDKRARAWDASQAIRERMEGDDYDPNAEDEAALRKALDEVENLTGQVETAERERRLAAVDFTPHPTQRTPEDERTPDEDLRREKRYAKEFDLYLRSGRIGTQLAEGYRAQSTDTTAGGYLIPAGFRQKLVEVMLAYGGFQPFADQLVTNEGNSVSYPVVDDTANGASYVDENSSLGAGTDLAFTQVSLGAPTLGVAPVLVSFQLAQDSAFNLDGFIRRAMGMRFGRKVADELINGNTSGKIVGLLEGQAGALTTPPSMDVKFKTGTVAAGLTKDNVPDIYDTIYALDKAYRANARWLISDTAIGKLRGLVDDVGRPLWEPSLQAGEPDRLAGFPIINDAAMPDGSTTLNTNFAAFGDWSQAYVVRQVRDIIAMRLVERYAEYGQVGYLAFLRVDGKPAVRDSWVLLGTDAT